MSVDFSRIKKYSKTSNNFDEKLEYLNKELKKTGLREGMVTGKMYQGSTQVPNQDYINFNGLSQGGYALGLSGADGNSLGNAIIGINPSTGQTGVALSPPHPVTGVRRVASTVTDGIGSNRSLRPGIGTRVRGTNDDGTPRVINDGSAVWFFDPSGDGRWLNFEWLDGELGFWDTNFLGFFFHNTNLDQYQLGGVNVGTQIKDKIAGINFGTNGEIGTPQTTVLVQNDLSDPGFLPINIKDLSKQGFDWLKGKAKDFYDKGIDNIGDLFKKFGKNWQDNTAGMGDKLKDNLNKVLKQGKNFVDDLFDANNAADYNAKLALGLGISILSGKKIDIPLSDSAKKDLINNIDADALKDVIKINNSTPTTADEAINPSGNKSADVLGGGWDAQGGVDFNFNEKTGELEIVSNKTLRTDSGGETTIKDKRAPNFEVDKLTDIPDASKESVQDLSTKIISDISTKLGGPGLDQNLSLEDQLKFMRDTYDDNKVVSAITDIASDLITQGTQGTAQNILALRAALQNLSIKSPVDTNAWKPFSGDSDIEKIGGAAGHVTSTTKFKLDDLPADIQKVIKDKLNKSESYELRKRESLNESVRLGHFEPEVLNVNIDDLRKGIAPEFPKDPPPEMIDGYSVKSRLAPKKIEGSPFINITKKDLARNHKLTDKEISDFMNDINMINDYIKKNPADLIYAQQRYPKHDPRLAQLNWQMDQMLDAGKEYIDKQFPENQKLFDKIKKKIKNTIDQTDPKNFKGTKLPKFDKTHLEDFKRKKEVYSRFMKKPVKTKKLFQKTKKRG